jgi:hypothetical protein
MSIREVMQIKGHSEMQSGQGLPAIDKNHVNVDE